jgi:beta-phosphoglucomutase-like phosphatase (HAD superfamily)
VAAVKPAPDAYRLALERLRLRPSEAIALEDSPTGLEAARAAGLRCLAIGHRRSRGDWVGTAEFVRDLSQVSRILEILGRTGASNP